MIDLVSLGVAGHLIHNLILVITYGLLGTVFLPGFIQRLDIPKRQRKLFQASCFTFFFLCAYTHFELMIHTSELPIDYFTLSHNISGFLQAIGSIVLLVVLRPLTTRT